MGDDWKQCPECAEFVRAEARKCRFCGWRFDGATADANASAGVARRLSGSRAQDQSLADLLESWGVELGPGEQVAFFLPARVERADGFILVTDLKLSFVGDLSMNPLRKLLSRSGSSAPGHALLFSLPVHALNAASTKGLRRRLTLRDRGGQEVVVDGLRHSDRDRIVSYLERSHTSPPRATE
jgi:hypothetical protein